MSENRERFVRCDYQDIVQLGELSSIMSSHNYLYFHMIRRQMLKACSNGLLTDALVVERMRPDNDGEPVKLHKPSN